ncbi:MAG TPA: hypothetical protein VNU46_07930, partial [Gemmatimonadaceae bacterium]|nr:hypothetical protein [Gemmatimonadaceae bacterium]
MRYRFISTPHFTRRALNVALASSVAVLAACSSDSTTAPNNSAFLGGTSSNHQIGLVLSSTGKSLSLFQLGSPTTMQQIALGTSSTVTPTDFSVNGRRVAIPLGDAASVAFVDL